MTHYIATLSPERQEALEIDLAQWQATIKLRRKRETAEIKKREQVNVLNTAGGSQGVKSSDHLPTPSSMFAVPRSQVTLPPRVPWNQPSSSSSAGSSKGSNHPSTPPPIKYGQVPLPPSALWNQPSSSSFAGSSKGSNYPSTPPPVIYGQVPLPPSAPWNQPSSSSSAGSSKDVKSSDHLPTPSPTFVFPGPQELRSFWTPWDKPPSSSSKLVPDDMANWIESENGLFFNAKEMEDNAMQECGDFISECIVVGKGRPSPVMFIAPSNDKVSMDHDKLREEILRGTQLFYSRRYRHERISTSEMIVIVERTLLPQSDIKRNLRREIVEEGFKYQIDQIFRPDSDAGDTRIKKGKEKARKGG